MQTILQAPSFLAFIILVSDKTKTDEPQATRLEEIYKSLECTWSMQKFINIGSRREAAMSFDHQSNSTFQPTWQAGTKALRKIRIAGQWKTPQGKVISFFSRSKSECCSETTMQTDSFSLSRWNRREIIFPQEERKVQIVCLSLEGSFTVSSAFRAQFWFRLIFIYHLFIPVGKLSKVVVWSLRREYEVCTTLAAISCMPCFPLSTVFLTTLINALPFTDRLFLSFFMTSTTLKVCVAFSVDFSLFFHSRLSRCTCDCIALSHLMIYWE